MIKSMTGYGKAEAATEHKKITVEIRSLNSKQLDLAVKLPSAYRQCEYEIRQTVGKRLQRGKIDVFVSYETVGRATGVTIDRDIFAHYAGQLRELAEASGLGWGSAAADAAAMTAILKLPDTVQNNSEAVSDEELTALGSAVAEALDRIDEFRAQEGTTLIADLLRRIDRIEQIKNEIEPYEKARYHLETLAKVSQYEIRQTVGKRLQRGKIDVFVSYETVGRATGVTIDRDIFAHYAGQLRELAEASGLGWGSAAADAAAMTAILKLPDTVQNNSEAVSDEELTALGSAVAEALDRIDEFRAQEGTTLIADLLRRIDRIEQIKNEIEPYEKARTETIKARIREHVESLGIPYDAGRLEQEMIYYIEKLDITEEKVRLQNHCRYFREVAHAEQGAGRKLGFIAQELGREINTLGSKSNEATMQKMVVEMKDELEKIKEQVLNIL